MSVTKALAGTLLLALAGPTSFAAESATGQPDGTPRSPLEEAHPDASDCGSGTPTPTPAPSGSEGTDARDDALFGASAAPAPQSPPADTSHDDVFGQPAAPPGGNETTQPASEGESGFKRPDEGTVFGSDYQTKVTEEAAPEDPLRIGGQIYMRLLGSTYEGYDLSESILSAPTLADWYFDARPNDRVRGMVVGRLSYNPLATDQSTLISSFTGSDDGSDDGATSDTSEDDPTAPQFILNQLWLRFDIHRTVFVTAGKQFVKWGASRFWNPTDFLQPVRRNPLEPFDVRTGVPMVKFHVPWEAKGWNFYAVAMLDNYQKPGTLEFVPASVPGYISGAFRAEVVLGTMEVGIDTLIQDEHPPKLGLDVSAGVGPLDLYAEVGVRKGVDGIYFRAEEVPTVDPSTGAPTNALALETLYDEDRVWASASGGVSWSTPVFGNATFSLGAEYFYNALGTDDATIYPLLLLEGVYQPFYVGRHYGALFANLRGPGSWNNSSFTLSTLSNLSDHSFLTRLDYSVSVLTHLQLEAYAAVHYGNENGELRFGFETSQPILVQGYPLPPFDLPAQQVDVGLSLRINI